MSRGDRVYLAWIAACFCYCVTQTGQVDQGRGAEQVLKNHASGAEGDVAVFRSSANYLQRFVRLCFGAQDVFSEDPEAHWQAGKVAAYRFYSFRYVADAVVATVYGQGLANVLAHAGDLTGVFFVRRYCTLSKLESIYLQQKNFGRAPNGHLEA